MIQKHVVLGECTHPARSNRSPNAPNVGQSTVPEQSKGTSKWQRRNAL